jgi:prepilin-type N-terminal cleavage/methylation domain-containing protein
MGLSAMFQRAICRSCRAFTLVELLVVIAIVGLLAGLAIPVIGRAQESSNRAKCVSNLKGLGQGMSAYIAESGTFPPLLESSSRGSTSTVTNRNWQTILADAGLASTQTKYSEDKGKNGLWYCPSALRSQKPNPDNSTTYAYSSFAGGEPTAKPPKPPTPIPLITSPAKMAVIMDGSWNSSQGFGSAGADRMPLCCHPPSRNTNDPSSSVNICFMDAHVEARKRSEIPTNATSVFWTGQD